MVMLCGRVEMSICHACLLCICAPFLDIDEQFVEFMLFGVVVSKLCQPAETLEAEDVAEGRNDYESFT